MWRRNGTANTTIAFASATGVSSIAVVGRLNTDYCPLATGSSVLYNAGTMTLHLAGGQTETTEMDVAGTVVAGVIGCEWSGSQSDVALAGTLSLSQYGPLTAIDLHPSRIPFCDAYSSPLTGQPWCHHWVGGQEFEIDNIQLANFKPALLYLTATDAADSTNHVTATSMWTSPDLYVAADANDQAEIDFTAAFNPPTIDNTPTGYYVNLVVTRDDLDDPVYEGSWYDDPSGTTLPPVLLAAIPGAQHFTAFATLTVWAEVPSRRGPSASTW